MSSGNDNKNKAVIDSEKKINESNDPRIDQDFKNVQDLPAGKKTISPETEDDKKTADVEHKDGEKMTKKEKDEGGTDEQDSDGSGGAFEATESTVEHTKNNDAKTLSQD